MICEGKYTVNRMVNAPGIQSRSPCSACVTHRLVALAFGILTAMFLIGMGCWLLLALHFSTISQGIPPDSSTAYEIRLNETTNGSKALLIGELGDDRCVAKFFEEGDRITSLKAIDMWFSFNLSVDIRPRKENGLIFAVLPAGDISDSLSLQLINGSVQFSFNNGVGPIIVKATPPAVCDGQWHSIRAAKMSAVASLIVDGQDKVSTEGPSSEEDPYVDVVQPFHVGSLPFNHSHLGGVPVVQYVGDLGRLFLDQLAVNLALLNISGKARVTSCSS